MKRASSVRSRTRISTSRSITSLLSKSPALILRDLPLASTKLSSQVTVHTVQQPSKTRRLRNNTWRMSDMLCSTLKNSNSSHSFMFGLSMRKRSQKKMKRRLRLAIFLWIRSKTTTRAKLRELLTGPKSKVEGRSESGDSEDTTSNTIARWPRLTEPLAMHLKTPLSPQYKCYIHLESALIITSRRYPREWTRLHPKSAKDTETDELWIASNYNLYYNYWALEWLWEWSSGREHSWKIMIFCQIWYTTEPMQDPYAVAFVGASRQRTPTCQ